MLDTIPSDLPLITILVFVALIALSVLTLTVAIFKVMQFRRMGVGRHNQAEAILDDWLNGRPDEAQRKAGATRSVLARVMVAVMSGMRARPGDPAYGEELARQVALSELVQMGARMRLLEAVVQMAPMLGLLGTVIGMIDAFGNLALQSQTADPSLLASGIWTALTTTAAGLAIALVAYFAAAWLEGRIEDERQTIEIVISAAIHGRLGQPGQG
ncbi:outer membrane transport energization protein ExbB [Paracoccus alcaliphilus]|uniref:Outer membrane transport energization protein ExbB n=1 Tax=Paracoccus alcaliphilus TaxID=34002 RepID=A0A1H8KRS8_9RHOB|nr:MotA/TolQ/ExbB proton channel family protein [Paracoccus alcaliphilus]WCR20446.1 MotA/TolQ/ExbB proton channel family protein [Paracoccus alcaliphilus]SEN95603.1 outer membrane transport energization protein ExbB [Paracoccus alcaliphilus]